MLIAFSVIGYYKGSMTINAGHKRKRKIPPPPPAPNVREELTAIEGWYLRCLQTLTAHLQRPPSLPELAQYCRRTVTPTYLALLSCERKGHARRNKARRWIALELDGVN